MTEPTYTDIEVQLTGQDGNAFFMIGLTRAALREAGVSNAKIAQFTEEATSGDYDNVIQTIMKWVSVS